MNIISCLFVSFRITRLESQRAGMKTVAGLSSNWWFLNWICVDGLLLYGIFYVCADIGRNS